MKIKKNITASIASIKSREKSLKITVNSLINQVDYLNIYLNNYDKIPFFLTNNPKINIMRSQDFKDLGDIGKFYWANSVEGYHFTCDDDLIYPPKYISYMIRKLKKYNGFISCHGAIFKKPFISFYKSKKNFSFKNDLIHDKVVNILGTGLLAYDADKIKIPLSIFKHKNMADVFIAVYAKKNNIQCTVVEHNEGFIRDYFYDYSKQFYLLRKFKKYINKFFFKSIYYKYKNNDAVQSQIISNNSPWDLD